MRPLPCLMSACIAVCCGAIAAQAAEEMTAIRQHRMGTIVVTTSPGATVRVEQQRHEFWFGAALANRAFDGAMSVADAEKYREVFLANFNSAVTENALKWLAMEPRRGHVNYAIVDAILAWTDQHQIPLRGHNIYWGVPQWTLAWQKVLGDDELRTVVQARAFDIGARYRGRFAEYDLNNEMIHGNFYAERLGPGITLEMAQWVQAKDPDAKLWLNDYDILTGRRLADYVVHIRDLLARGVPIAGIGVQGHLHGETFDRDALRHALDELAQFRLPIRVTEFNVPGQRSRYYKDENFKTHVLTRAEEEEKAGELTDFYRICFAHPAVTGILMWGFWEGANWIPQSSLYKRDWTPTPAAQAYRDLVFKEWWTSSEIRADASGRAEVPAFFGTHRVTVGGMSLLVNLRRAEKSALVTIE